LTRSGPGATSDLGPLWYLLARREWTTLAVVSPDNNAAASRLARALVALAGARHCVLEARDASEFRLRVAAAAKLAASEIAHPVAGGPWRFLLPIDSVLDNPHAGELVAACDVVVIVLEKGRSGLKDAVRSVGLVGPERLLGAVLGSP
jgi:hypothetical protein